MFLRERLPFVFLGTKRLQVLDHPLQAFRFFSQSIGIGRRFFQSFSSFSPDFERLPNRLEDIAVLCKIVKELELVGRLEKRLMRVLPVYVHQRFAEFAQLRGGDNDTVHPGT